MTMKIVLEGELLWTMIQKAICEKFGITLSDIGTMTAKLPEDQNGQVHLTITVEVRDGALNQKPINGIYRV